jgi:hypothetical protein
METLDARCVEGLLHPSRGNALDPPGEEKEDGLEGRAPHGEFERFCGRRVHPLVVIDGQDQRRRIREQGQERAIATPSARGSPTS